MLAQPGLGGLGGVRGGPVLLENPLLSRKESVSGGEQLGFKDLLVERSG